MIELIAMDFLTFFIEIAKLFPLMYWGLCFRLKPKKKIALWCGVAFLLVLAQCFIPNSRRIPLEIYVSCFVVGAIIEGKSKWLYTLVTYIGICMLDMLLFAFALIFVEVNYETLVADDFWSMLLNAAWIVVIVFFSLFVNKKRKEEIRLYEKMETGYLWLILLGELALSAFITGFQTTEGTSKVMAVLLCVGGIVFLIIGIVFIVNYFSKNHYKSLSEINGRLLESQEKYYTMLLEKNQETIRFRHDIRKHIDCMYLLFEKKQYAQLKEYFEKIGASLAELSTLARTGNDLINAILSDCIARYPEVTCEVKGMISKEIYLSRMELCTIFSNLLDNAFAAAQKAECKKVSIDLAVENEELWCEISNTIHHKIDMHEKVFQTEKADKINHGHGIYNVRQVIEKNDGIIRFTCDEEFFYVEFVLNIGIDTTEL